MLRRTAITAMVLVMIGCGWILGYREWEITGQWFAGGAIAVVMTLLGFLALFGLWGDTE